MMRRRFIPLLSLMIAASLTAAAQNNKLNTQSVQEMTDNYHVPEDPLVRQHLEDWSKMKFGMFIHWGIYSEIGVIESWSLNPQPTSWMYRARMERGMSYNEYVDFYHNLYRSFYPAEFNPSDWAEAASKAGMKYVVFTTKHHDGFCMFDTKETDYKVTAPECPWGRTKKANITKEVFEAFRAKGLKTGAYFSIADWHNQDYWWDMFPPKDTKVNYPVADFPKKWERFKNFVVNQIGELTDGTYGPLEMLWFDLCNSSSDGSATVDWDRIAAKARENQPGILMVARSTGNNYEDYKTPEQAIPAAPMNCPWESCITMTGSWSYRPGWAYKSTREILDILVKVVSRGGSLLLNVGPRPDGTLEPEAYERLAEIGNWMDVNSEAIYETTAWSTVEDGKVCFTAKGDTVYAFYLADKDEDAVPSTITFKGVSPKSVRMLGDDKPLKFKVAEDGTVSVTIPERLRAKKPCDHIWTLKLAI